MARRRVVTLGVLVAAVGWAQEALRRVLGGTLGGQVGIVAPPRREVEAAINAIGHAAGTGCRRARLTEG